MRNIIIGVILLLYISLSFADECNQQTRGSAAVGTYIDHSGFIYRIEVPEGWIIVSQVNSGDVIEFIPDRDHKLKIKCNSDYKGNTNE